jgi:YVTN family beta-propeller protein
MRVPRKIAAALLVSFSIIHSPGAAAQDGRAVILQTNAAGDQVHVIDPATNTVSGIIEGIPIPHGVTSHPDGTLFYVSNEHDRTLDVISSSTLKVVRQIPLSGGPHNISITPDGRKIYVGIMSGEPAVDVIDTRTQRLERSIPMEGGIHNTFVTPDGKFAVAGSIAARQFTVIDTNTDEPVWSLRFEPELGLGSLEDAGVRPMAFETNEDGSTKHVFVQTSGFHGFHVIDFATRRLVRSIRVPAKPLAEIDNDGLQGSPGHGLEVTDDGRTLWFASKPHNSVYAWSLPDFQFLGGVPVGYHPDWLTSTPDSRYLYAANAGSNNVSVVDRETMTEIARIPVGQTPKRNHTAIVTGRAN